MSSRVYLDVLNALVLFFFFFNDTATTEIYTLSLHDALPICTAVRNPASDRSSSGITGSSAPGEAACWPAINTKPFGLTSFRSEEHTSELQSLTNLVCRLLLEKKKIKLQDIYSAYPVRLYDAV